MKNFLTFVVISFVSAALFCGCKEKKNTGSDFLQHLVEEINNQPDKTFANESLKNSVAAELSSKKMHKLTSTLAKHAIGIKYIFEQEDKEVVVEFAPSEFSAKK